jgi:hypothetical protein
MNVYHHTVSGTSRPVLMFAGEPRLDATGELTEVERHPAGRLVVRVIAACAFVAALFALIGGAIELALAL